MTAAAFVNLDGDLFSMLRCPLCKGELSIRDDSSECSRCVSTYAKRAIDTGAGTEWVYDFRIDRGRFSNQALTRWDTVQQKYEGFTDDAAAKDHLESYLVEIDSVREIYAEEFDIGGDVLDVGGHQGRLRHFLRQPPSGRYVSVDPFVNVFEGIAKQSSLLQAYPVLREPCNFLCAHAEHLPIEDGGFDWVHMRSVLDHFYDPYLALKEAVRVLRPGGRILIGLTVEDPPRGSPPDASSAGRADRLRGDWGRRTLVHARDMARRVAGRDRHAEHHMMLWRRSDVYAALEQSGFSVVKEHWQKPPYSMCLYVAAERNR